MSASRFAFSVALGTMVQAAFVIRRRSAVVALCAAVFFGFGALPVFADLASTVADERNFDAAGSRLSFQVANLSTRTSDLASFDLISWKSRFVDNFKAMYAASDTLWASYHDVELYIEPNWNHELTCTTHGLALNGIDKRHGFSQMSGDLWTLRNLLTGQMAKLKAVENDFEHQLTTAALAGKNTNALSAKITSLRNVISEFQSAITSFSRIVPQLDDEASKVRTKLHLAKCPGYETLGNPTPRPVPTAVPSPTANPKATPRPTPRPTYSGPPNTCGPGYYFYPGIGCVKRQY